MLPTGLLYLLVKDLLAGSTSGECLYLLGCAACFALILLTTWFQYNGTYFTTTYKERRHPPPGPQGRNGWQAAPVLFGKRDLADLTSTIMADCRGVERRPHFIPGLFGSSSLQMLIA